MEGGARKVITVRSSLVVKNRLDVPMEVRLDSPSAPDSKINTSQQLSNILFLTSSSVAVKRPSEPEDGSFSAVPVSGFTLDRTKGESILSGMLMRLNPHCRCVDRAGGAAPHPACSGLSSPPPPHHVAAASSA